MAVLFVRTDERRSKWHAKQLRIVEIPFVVWLIHALHATCWANMWAMDLLLC